MVKIKMFYSLPRMHWPSSCQHWIRIRKGK